MRVNLTSLTSRQKTISHYCSSETTSASLPISRRKHISKSSLADFIAGQCSSQLDARRTKSTTEHALTARRRLRTGQAVLVQ